MKPTHVIIPIAALTGVLTACTSAASRPGHPRTGCAQAHTPVAMIPARPGSVLGHAKPVADVFRSARFSQELMAAEPAAAEELRSDEHRLGADGRAFAADRTARLARAVLADLRAIQAYCA